MRIKLGLEDVAEFVIITSGFESDINIRSASNGIVVDAKSIMSVIGLDLGGELVVDINSSNAEEVENFVNVIGKYKIKEELWNSKKLMFGDLNTPYVE